MEKRKRLTIQDIADIVGVSKTTVSRYINGKYGNMSTETKENIRLVIEETGYRPSRIANALKTNKSGLVGLVLGNATASLTPYLLGSISDVVVQHEKKLIVANSNDNPSLERSLVKGMLDQQIEGLIVTSGYNFDFYEKLNGTELPVVLIDRIPQNTSMDVISINHRESSVIVAEHLIKKGFKKIVVVSSKITNPNSTLIIREEAVIDTYKKSFGKDSQCESIHIENSSYEKIKNVDDEIKIILRDKFQESRTNPTAIFITDTSLMGRFIGICHLLNIKLDERFTIAGYDFWNFRNMISPPITTIEHPIMELGRLATEHLIEQIETTEETEKVNPKTLQCTINFGD